MSVITLLTSAGAVRVAGDNLVIDIRNLESVQGPIPVQASLAAREADESAAFNPETPASPSTPVTAPGRMKSSPSVRDTYSAPSKAETGRAGGPNCAPVANQEPAERHPARSVSGAFVSSKPAGSVGVPHSIPHKSGELKDQPANISDPRDPGPIPSFLDRRAKKEAA